MRRYHTTGPTASRLRQRKHELVRRFRIPQDALPGSLALSHRRCGKPTCRCAEADKGHPAWSLTFMADGRKRVVHIPAWLADEIRPFVEEGRAYKDAVAEVFAINAQLLALWRRQQSVKAKAAKKAKRR